MRHTSIAIIACAALTGGTRAAAAQTRPSPLLDSAAIAHGPRPIPGPVYESQGFTRAVMRGTRTRTGAPGPNYWVQHPRYQIHAVLDSASHRLSGKESVIYRNFSPDTLHTIAVYLRQNAFAPGAPRRQSVPVTEGVALQSVMIDGNVIQPAQRRNAAMPITAPPEQPPAPGEYAVDNTVMRIPLASPLLPGASLTLDVAWSYTPAPSPADGREGREGNLYFMGYWYPQIAVYDDVDGWVTDPYLLEAEFYMDPADYDVDLGVPHGWTVTATGTLQNADTVLSAPARDSLGVARRTGRVVRVVTPGPGAAAAFAGSTPTASWHFVANDVRDFSWSTTDAEAWDATRALVPAGAAAMDTIDINSFFQLNDMARAWEIGGARFTRDAIERMSSWLWAYPWTTMSSVEGVLDDGGMEYPMMTVMQPWADTLSLAGDLMHETGHMWFPMQVGSNETRYPWMDEGFTQFDVAQGMAAQYGESRTGGRANDSEHGQRALYVGSVRNGGDAPLMLPGDEFPQDLYLVIYYDKTAQVLSALRAILGDSVFHRAFVDYGKAWIGRHPQPFDFFNAIDAAAGRDLSWFWTTWFYHAWPLDQAIESAVTRGDSLVVTVSDRGVAPMPVLLAATRRDGSVQRITLPVGVWLGGSRAAAASFSDAASIVQVTIDPDGAFPDVDRGNQTVTAGAGWPRL
ncbi:MAG: M1 family metallopeptidase [Gemmatimonadales bacterium]